jgi:hypothetical protein
VTVQFGLVSFVLFNQTGNEKLTVGLLLAPFGLMDGDVMEAHLEQQPMVAY